MICLLRLNNNSPYLTCIFITRVAGEALNDNSAICLSPKVSDQLQLSRGDIVTVRGNRGKDTLLIVVNHDLDDSHAHLNAVARQNLGVTPGDTITLHLCLDYQHVSNTPSLFRIHIDR